MELSYAFILFFISLGPLKVIPMFYLQTSEFTNSDIRKIAIRGVIYSTLILVSTAFIAHQLLHAWKLSLPAFTIAGGIMLFISSIKSIFKFKNPFASAPINKHRKSNGELDYNKIAISPVSIPIIISPIGMVAVIAIISYSHIHHDILDVLGMLAIIMAMDGLAMICARFIMDKVGLPAFSILGWIFSILQAGLAVQFIVNSIHKLF